MHHAAENRYLVSAIVSTYNAERFLAGKLEDLEAQTIADRLEIIVIDSGSRQNERAIVSDFQRRYGNIRYLRTERRETVYQAWNRGIRMASGEFVANANTDDRLRRDAYEVLVGALRTSPEAVLAYADMRVTLNENETFDRHTGYGFKTWPDFDRLSLLELCCIGPFPLWRRSLHDAIGYFDERFKSAADYEFWLRAATGHTFVHVPDFLGLYWLNEETVSRKGDLPTLEYLQIQKIYRGEYAPLTPLHPPLPAGAADEYLRLERLLEEGSRTEAQAALERFVERHPDFARGHHDLAELYYRKEEIGLAKKHFEKAALLSPAAGGYAEKLMSVLRLEFFQSLQYHAACLTQAPDDLETLLCLGMICQFLELEAARGHYLRVLKLDPENALARANLAALAKGGGADAPAGSAGSPPTARAADGYYEFARPEVQQLVSRRARTILDVGCAAGKVGEGLKRRQGAEVWGVEPHPEAAARAAKRLDRVFAAPVEEALAGLPHGYFDCVICADILEHLVDPEAVLGALKARLAPGGTLIASIPNVRHWSVLKGLLEGAWEYQEAGILDRTHLRFFTRSTAAALFERAGYTVKGIRPVRLQGEEGVPGGLLTALTLSGIDTATLEEETRDLQYLISAVPKERVLVSIVIPTFNEIDCTRQCLESIERNTPEEYEVLFVDNGSSDGTVEWLRELCRHTHRCRLLENGENLGFAVACTRGMAAASGAYLCLLNNDTLVTADWLSGMLAHFERDERLGLVGPMTNECAGPQRVQAPQYASIEELEEFARAFRGSHRERRIAVERLVGFCLLIPRPLLESVGGLDSAFGNGNYEDDDLSLRAALSGYRLAIAGDVFIHHYGSRSFTANGIDHGAAMTANRKIFHAKWDLGGLEEDLAKRLISHNAMTRARLLSHQERLDEAAELLLQEGIRFSPQAAAPCLLLAQLLASGGRFGEALEVLELVPRGEEPLCAVLAGECRLRLGETEEARRFSALALEGAPGSAAALHLAGQLALWSGDAAGGEALLGEAIVADPGFAPPYRTLGRHFRDQGEVGKALSLAQTGFMLDPQDMEGLALYHGLASLCGALAGEEELVREALEIFPHHRGLRFGLIDLLLAQGNFHGAMAQIERGAAHFPLDDATIDAALSVRRRIGPRRAQRAGHPTISLCMIVKDEAHHLPRALVSALPVAQEIIVVDTGSADRSADIAALFGARVHHFPWSGSFAEARNASLDCARGDYILVLDADEVLAGSDLARLAGLVAGEPQAAYIMTTRNYTDSFTRRNWTANRGEYPGEEAGCGWTPSQKVRLFPNDPRVRFSGEVHELVEDSLLGAGIPVAHCPVPVHHYGRLDAARGREKQQSYYELGLRKLRTGGDEVKPLVELAIQATELERWEEGCALWERVLAAEPGHPEAFFNLGYIKLRTGEYRAGWEYSRRASGLDPQLKEAAFNAAQGALYLGYTGEAAERCRAMLQAWPDYPPVLALLSAACLLSEEGEGVELMEKLHRMHFDCADYLRDHAEGVRRGGNPEGAALLLSFATGYVEGASPLPPAAGAGR